MKHGNKMMRIALHGLAVMAVAGMTCRASILIDYVDLDTGNGIHDTAVRDGDFETDAPQDGNDVTNGTFWATTGTLDYQLLSNMESPNGGGQNTTIGTEPGGGLRQLGQDTGHVLGLGDQFQGSFDWRDAYGWNPGETIDMFLFYTDDNTLGGARSVLTTLNSGDETINNTWETETLSLTAALTDAGAVGKTLFVAFEGNGVTANSYSRLDNVYLEAIPEPATLGMVALFGGGVLFIRRRLMM